MDGKSASAPMSENQNSASPARQDRDILNDKTEEDLELRIAPDQFDEKYRTTKWEIWAYYAWVNNR
jgi:hypothetical protein